MQFGFSRRKVVRQSQHKSRRPAPKRRRLFFDSLEDRRMLSSAPVLNWDLHLNSAQETYGLATATDQGGNIFVAGGFSATTNFNPNGSPVDVTPAVRLAGSDPFLAKYSPGGALEWVDEIAAPGAGGSQGATGARLAVGGSGDVYLLTGVNNTGVARGAAIALQVTTYSAQDSFQPSMASFSEVNHGGVLGRFNTESGTATWLEEPPLNGSIAVDRQDNVYLTRTFGGTQYVNPDPTGTQTVTAAAGTDAVFVEKLDSSGKYLWAESVADGPLWYNYAGDSAQDIAVDPSGNIYLAGYFYGTSNFYPQLANQPQQGAYDLTSSVIPKSKNGYSAFQTYSMFVEKLDTNGAFDYAHGTSGPGAAYGKDIAVDAAGEVYVGALYNGTVNFGMGGSAHSLASSEGTKTQLSGPFDTAILKLDSNGNFSWVDNFATKTADLTGLLGTVVDPSNNVYVYGQFNGTADFDPGSGVTTFTSSADNGNYLVKLSPSGAMGWAAQSGGGEQYQGKMLAVDAAGNIDRTGWLSGPMNLAPAPGEDVTPNAQYGDAFLAQWSQPVAAVNGATHFSVSAAANTTAGTSFDVTVTALDADGNLAADYNGAVNLTSTDGQAVLSAGALANGTGTFLVTLKTSGNQTVTATDSGNGSISGTSGAITVTAAAAAKIVFTSAPASVTSGATFSLTIEVTDAYGNAVAGYVGTVHFSLSGGSGSLPANYTFTAADAGVHTFTGLALTQTSKRSKQSDTITATDTQNSSLTGSVVVKV